MKKSLKKLLGLCLVLTMVVTMCGFSGVFAAEGVSIVSPSADSVLEIGSTVTVTATAPDGGVEFFANGVSVGSVENAVNGVYSLDWTPTEAIRYSLTAKSGSITSDAISVQAARSTEAWFYDVNKTGTGTVNKKAYSSYLPFSDLVPGDTEHGQVLALAPTGGQAKTEFQYCAINSEYVSIDTEFYFTKLASAYIQEWYGWNTLMEFTPEGKINSRLGEIGTYEAGKWYKSKFVIHFDGTNNPKLDIYLNGVQLAKQLSLNNMAFEAQDNKRFYAIANNSVSDAVFCIKSFAINTLTIPAALETVTVTAPAASSVLEQNVPVILKAAATGSDVASLEFFANGTSAGYGVNDGTGSFSLSYIPDTAGTTEIYAKAYSSQNQSIESAVRNVNVMVGKTHYLYDPDSSQCGNANRQNYSANVLFNTVNDTDTTRGYVLQLSPTGGQAKTEFQYASLSTEYVTIDLDFYMSELGNAGIIEWSGWNSFLSLSADGKIGSRVGELGTYEAGKWYNAKYVIHFDGTTNPKVDIYIDGMQVKSQEAFANFVFIGQDKKRFYATAENNNANLKFCIDKFEVSTLATAPQITDTIINNNSAAALDPATLHAADIANLVTTMDCTVNAASVTTDTVKLYKGSTNVAVPISVAASGNTITVTPTQPLEHSYGYKLCLSTGVQSEAGIGIGSDYEYTFRTLSAGKGTQNGVFKIGTQTISSLSGLTQGDTVSFSTDVYGTESENIMVFLAYYSNDGSNTLEKCMVNPAAAVASDRTPVSVSLQLPKAPTAGDFIRAFVWNDAASPYGDAYTLD